MNRFYRYVILTALVLSTAFLQNAFAGDKKDVYVCFDPAHPCFSEKSEDCATCGKSLVKKEYDLELIMDFISKLSGMLKDDIKANAHDAIIQKGTVMQTVAGKIPEFKPDKNKEKIADFNKFAGELGQYANALVEAGKKKDANALKDTYKNLTNSCSQCHKAFR